jgi:hypothetical protein
MEESTLPPDPDSIYEGEPSKSGITREVPENITQARKALVGEWQSKILRAKRHWEDSHKSMRADMDFFMGKQWKYGNGDKYVANLVQRHVQQRVASLYAKNPKAVAKRRDTLDFVLWDGNPGTLQAAQTVNDITIRQTGMQDPNSMALMNDVAQGMAARKRSDKIARTLEIIFHQFVESQNLKTQMKQLVRRVCVTGVGFVKIGYHRMLGKRPEDVEKITDITEQLATLTRLIADKKDGEFQDDDYETEQLRLMLKELSEKEDFIIDEGLVFDFPQSSTVIIDPRCRQLKGFIGAEWIAQEFTLDTDEIKEIYGIDLGTNYSARSDDTEQSNMHGDKAKREGELARVWEIYCKRDGMKYVIAEGYPEFLVEPGHPELNLKRFWPFFVLTFNEVENDREIYPPSDIALLRPVQEEYNLARQRLREHRNANRPLYVTPIGSLTREDVQKLQTRDANEVIQLQAIQPGQSVDSVLQAVKPAPIDPALYDTSMFIDDLFRIVGSQEANMGGTGSSTATEVSVAESSRMSALGSNVDDLDDFLTEVSRAAGAVLLTMMDPVTATKIAGPGAVWPTLSAQEAAEELVLEIEAGSSGRPNRAAEIAAFERVAPILLQIPGIDPVWLAKQAIKRLDDSMDLTDALAASLPSIVAQNAQKQVATGDASADPNMQGGQGGNNAAAGPEASGAAPGVPNVPQPNLYNEPSAPPNAL